MNLEELPVAQAHGAYLGKSGGRRIPGSSGSTPGCARDKGNYGINGYPWSIKIPRRTGKLPQTVWIHPRIKRQGPRSLGITPRAEGGSSSSIRKFPLPVRPNVGPHSPGLHHVQAVSTSASPQVHFPMAESALDVSGIVAEDNRGLRLKLDNPMGTIGSVRIRGSQKYPFRGVYLGLGPPEKMGTQSYQASSEKGHSHKSGKGHCESLVMVVATPTGMSS